MRRWFWSVIVAGLTSSVGAQNLEQFKLSMGEVEFLRFGKPLYQQQVPLPEREIRKYEEAISRLDSASACAFEASNGIIKVGRSLDWTKIKSFYDLEVCLFFVASALRDADALSDFLSGNGISNVNLRREAPVLSKWKNVEGFGISITGGLPLDILPDDFNGFFGTSLAYGGSISVYLDQNGKPFDVSAKFNYN